MRKLACLLALAMMFQFGPRAHASPSDESVETITEIGDIIQFALPITAGVATLFEPDWEGSKQFALSFGSAVAINSTAKLAIGKLRPNENNYYSYPSGHSMAAFSGAGFIMERYGPIYGWPAMAAAGFVGYSRVLSENHYADDVLAGASIGLMMNWVWVTPYEGRAKIEPTVFNNGAPGMKITILDRAPSGAAGPTEDKVVDPRFFYIFDFGPVYNARNEVRSPLGAPGFDLTQFDDFENQTAASRVFFGWMPGDRHNLALEIAPYETRNKEALTEPIQFQGVSFGPADGDIRYSYKLYEIRFRYMYDFIEDETFWLRGGAALSYYHNELEMADESGAKYARNSTDTVLPQVSFSAGWWFAKNFALFGDVNWGQLSGQRAQDFTAGVTWQIADQWNMSAGYRYYDRLIEEDDWYNHLTQHQPFLSFGYFF